MNTSAISPTSPDLPAGIADPPPPAIRFLAWVYLLTAACFQVAIVFAPLPFFVRELTVDDTYLYLEIARNWVELGWPTFDGQHATSGFQPLWNFILMGLAWGIEERTMLLRMTCLTSALFNVLTAPLVFRLGRAVATPRVAYVAMTGWTTYLYCPRSACGMEAPLHGAIFALTALVALHAWRALPQVSPRMLLRLGALLALNGLCRLDSGIISALVAGCFAWRLLTLGRLRQVLLLAVVPAVVLSAYLGVNQLYFGAATPVSGRTKMYWAYASDPSVATAARTVVVGTARSLSNALMNVSGGGEAYSYPWLPILAALLLLTAFQCWRAARLDGRLVAWTAMMLIHTAIVYLMLQHLAKSHWYYQPLRVWAAVIIGHLAFMRLPMIGERAMRTVGAAAVLAACAYAAWRGGELYSRRNVPSNVPDARVQLYEMGLWLSTTDALPRDARIASWNAGELAWFGHPRQIVNLDGLVQSADFLPRVIRTGQWNKYLRENEIDYLVDLNHQDATQTYRRKWDRAKTFRDLVPLERARRMKEIGPLMLLDIRPWLAAEDDPAATP